MHGSSGTVKTLLVRRQCLKGVRGQRVGLGQLPGRSGSEEGRAVKTMTMNKTYDCVLMKWPSGGLAAALAAELVQNNHFPFLVAAMMLVLHPLTLP